MLDFRFFDLRTAYLVMGMLYLVMPMVVGYALRRTRSQAVLEWCLGGILFGLGLFFLGQRGSSPDWLTFELAAALVNGAQLLRLQALSREMGRHWSSWRSAGMLCFYILVYVALRRAGSDGTYWHYLLSLILLGIYFSWIAWLAYLLAQRDRVISAYWLVVAYLPLALVIVIQIHVFLFGAKTIHPLSEHWAAIVLVLMGNLTAVIGNVAFMGVYVERAIRKQVESAATQAKEAESRRLERQIAQLDRARSLVTISATLAHELSQPVSSLRLVAEHTRMAMERSNGVDKVHLSQWDKVLVLIDHVSQVISRIRGFIQDTIQQPVTVDLHEVHRNVCMLLGSPSSADAAQIELDIKAQHLLVQGDPVQLAQVFLNLYRNAFEATAQTRPRRIKVAMFSSEHEAKVVVTDNGPGFDPQALAQATEGFFSTKSGGLGMGLLISRQIIEAHGGQLEVSNSSEGGGRVEVRLPIQLTQT